MRVVELDDGSGRMEVTVFNELYDARKHVLKVDDVLIVSAKIDNDEYSGGLRGSAVEILTLAEARCRFGAQVEIRLQTTDQLVHGKLSTLVEIAKASSSSRFVLPVVFEVADKSQACLLRSGKRFCLDSQLLDKPLLSEIFGSDHVKIRY